MFLNLSAFLDNRATPDQKAVMMRACRVLLDAGYTDHEAFLEQEVITSGIQEEDLYLSLMVEYVTPLYRKQLQMFGIVVSLEAEQPILSSMLEAVLRLDNWDDPAAINALADHDEDPAQTLADLLSIVGQDSTEDYLAALDDVSSDLIQRIADVTAQQLETDEDPEPDAVVEGRIRAHNRVMRYRPHVAPDRYTLLDHYLENQGRLNESVRIIVFPYYHELKAMDVKVAAEQTLMLLTATNLPEAELVRATMGLVEQLEVQDELQLTNIAATIAGIQKKASTNESV